MTSRMNRSADPCDNFYKYACGNFKQLNDVSIRHNLEDKVSFLTQISDISIKHKLKTDALKFKNKKSTAMMKLKKTYFLCSYVHSYTKYLKNFDIIDAYFSFDHRYNDNSIHYTIARIYNYTEILPFSDLYVSLYNKKRIIKINFHYDQHDLLFYPSQLYNGYRYKNVIIESLKQMGYVITIKLLIDIKKLVHFIEHVDARNIDTIRGSFDNNLIYKKKRKCIIDQYSHVNISGVMLNGEKTIYEDIADLGGIKIGYKAMEHAKNLINQKLINFEKFTKEQMYFLSYAQSYCHSYPDYHLKHMVFQQHHSIHEARVNMPLSNFDKFSKAFKCSLQTNMNLKDKCALW
ncbi:hypothetical protein A3Q56_00471 [Intoshia linei]|uniref:Peptidase M13 C-terminal domain-containing protein n=1 Tax=Intoshia linei TaxID=1819745 RepID=A0A177BDZ2_9BILA|nr:hypothetical protein A3Q56_00471 [Intoshia linei]